MEEGGTSQRVAVGDQEVLGTLNWLVIRRGLHYLLYDLQIFILLPLFSFANSLVGKGKLFPHLTRFSLIARCQVQSERLTTLSRAGVAESQGQSNASFLLLLNCPQESSSGLILKVFTPDTLAANLNLYARDGYHSLSPSPPSLSFPGLCLNYSPSVTFGFNNRDNSELIIIIIIIMQIWRQSRKTRRNMKKKTKCYRLR